MRLSRFLSPEVRQRSLKTVRRHLMRFKRVLNGVALA